MVDNVARSSRAASKQNRYLSAVFLLTVRGLETASCGLFFIPDWWSKGTLSSDTVIDPQIEPTP